MEGMNNHLTLDFIDSQLFRIAFHNTASKSTRCSYRGRVVGYPGQTGTFGWSRGAIALTVLLLGHKLTQFDPGVQAVLVGVRGSLASSLYGSLVKESVWLAELFGISPTGELYAKRLLRIQNPGLKRSGPLRAWCNDNWLAADQITVTLDEAPITERRGIADLLLKLLNEVSAVVQIQFTSAHPTGTREVPILTAEAAPEAALPAKSLNGSALLPKSALPNALPATATSAAALLELTMSKTTLPETALPEILQVEDR